jgi:hypothetical protein
MKLFLTLHVTFCVQRSTYSLHLYNIRIHAEIFSIHLQFLLNLTHIKNYISSLPLCNKPQLSWLIAAMPSLFWEVPKLNLSLQDGKFN